MNTEENKVSLESELENVTNELKSIAKQNPKTDDWVAIPDEEEIGNADPNVEADATEEWNKRRALMTQLETRYRNIKLALEKIESNTYGQCEICSSEIETDRLQANLSARTCKSHLDQESKLIK